MSFYAYLRAGEARYQERFGLDFEEFAVGQRFKHRPGVTLSQQDNLDEALDTLNAAMLHYDAHYAAQTTWKRPLLVSTVTIQRVIGMASRTFGRKQAIAGFTEIALTGPVFGGDTLYAESEIAGVRDGGADHGIVTVISRGVTPDGREVARLTYDVAVYRRGRHPDEIGRPAAPPAEEERFMLYAPLPDGTLLEHYGIFFEDARPGETFVHYPRRTFYRDEAVEHALRSLEVNPQFHDQSWIARHQDGRQRIQETWLITAATAATTRTFGRVVANLGWTDVKLPTPVYAGDTTEAESTIVDKRESKSRPNEGILTVDTRAYNQKRELVLSYRRNLLVYKRTAETPYAAAGYAPKPRRSATPDPSRGAVCGGAGAGRGLEPRPPLHAGESPRPLRQGGGDRRRRADPRPRGRGVRNRQGRSAGDPARALPRRLPPRSRPRAAVRAARQQPPYRGRRARSRRACHRGRRAGLHHAAEGRVGVRGAGVRAPAAGDPAHLHGRIGARAGRRHGDRQRRSARAGARLRRGRPRRRSARRACLGAAPRRPGAHRPGGRDRGHRRDRRAARRSCRTTRGCGPTR